ncbi:MAG TPA: alpha/beta hydrolase [Acidobacteriaceae bacterium]|nr:alpha/beta hydrolase [Acidobacteriaceae bacterium]
MRRRWLGAGVGFVLGMGGAMGLGQIPVKTAAEPPVPVLLWAQGAPRALGEAEEDKPTLTAYIPAVNPTRTAVVIAPGGGYQHLAMGYEGADVAVWLNAHGVAAFVLKYRLGMKYHSPVELEDAQRAIRMVRAGAEKYGVAKDRIGMWGFSAGGHLAATAGTQFDAGDAGAADVVERESSRPDFLVLAYPVISMQDGVTHMGSQKFLLGEGATQAAKDAMSAEMHVTKETPPTFLFATTDDNAVPVMNSVMFYAALVKAGVPVEMHLFQHGRHGVGLAVGNAELSGWPELLMKWMRERGYAAS